MLARIYFGLVDKFGETVHPGAYTSALAAITDSFPDHTILEGIGCWQGEHEPCRIVEIETADTPEVRCRIGSIAADIREVLNQTSVGVSFTPSEFFLF